MKGNSRYYNYDLNINGVIEKHGKNYATDYFTDRISKIATDYLQDYNPEEPLLMVIGFSSPHAPFTPAPQYETAFSDVVTPRLPSFNHVEEESEAKHWFVRRHPRPLNQTLIGLFCLHALNQTFEYEVICYNIIHRKR